MYVAGHVLINLLSSTFLGHDSLDGCDEAPVHKKEYLYWNYLWLFSFLLKASDGITGPESVARSRAEDATSKAATGQIVSTWNQFKQSRTR